MADASTEGYPDASACLNLAVSDVQLSSTGEQFAAECQYSTPSGVLDASVQCADGQTGFHADSE